MAERACSNGRLVVTNLQTIVSRRLDPADIGVVSVTELITDGTRNALPGVARILGDARSFRSEISETIERQMRIIAEGTEVLYTREFVPLANDPGLTEEALAVARDESRPWLARRRPSALRSATATGRSASCSRLQIARDG